MNKRIVCICMSVLLCLTVICTDTGTDVHARYYEDNDKYIEQRVADRMKKMSWEEKIAQMILVKAPAKNAVNIQKQYQFGGYVLFGEDFANSTPDTLRNRIYGIQKASKIPMLIAVDEEGGTVVRASRYRQFRSTSYASPRAVFSAGGWNGIVKDTKNKAKFLKKLGINTNLAPVADVAYDSGNFIYNRSFSTNAADTSRYINLVVNNMKQEDMISSLKHFPGYGNNGDTHTNLNS